jgi:hypothetical protein
VSNRTSAGRPDSVEALFALNPLQDADKHGNLALLVAGIAYPEVSVSWGKEGFTIITPTYVAPGEELIEYDELGNRIPYDQVRVEVRGRPQVAVNISKRDDYELLDVAGGIVGRVRDRILPSMEPFVRT